MTIRLFRIVVILLSDHVKSIPFDLIFLNLVNELLTLVHELCQLFFIFVRHILNDCFGGGRRGGTHLVEVRSLGIDWY